MHLNDDSGREFAPSSPPQLPWEAMLAYIPIFCLYPWSLRNERPELRPYVRQGMILFGVEIALLLVSVPTFYKLLWLSILVLAGVGVIHAIQGKVFKIPLLSPIVDELSHLFVTTPPEEKPKP